MLFLSGFIMTDHNHVRRGCHYHVRRGYVRLYESWFDSMSRWFDHELPQPRPTWLWLPRPFPPGSSSARRSSSAIHIHGGAGGDYPVCGCEQEYATLRTSRRESLARYFQPAVGTADAVSPRLALASRVDSARQKPREAGSTPPRESRSPGWRESRSLVFGKGALTQHRGRCVA